MEMNNLFIEALKNHYTFPMRGTVSTEDLFDCSPVELDKLHKELSKRAKTLNGDGGLLQHKNTVEEKELENKMAIVRFIFETKEKEKKEKAEKEQKKAMKALEKQRILDILAEKENAKLHEMSEADLRAQLDALEGDE